jgi:hypothetical protein
MAAPTASTAGPRVFASNSITSRRFPALRTRAADDVEVMVMPPASAKKQNAESKPLFDPNVIKPSAVGSLGAARPAKAEAAAAASSGRAMRQRPPFRPCNPTEAKETITEIRNGYVGIHSEYDRAHTLELEERKDAEEHVIGGRRASRSRSTTFSTRLTPRRLRQSAGTRRAAAPASTCGAARGLRLAHRCS